MANVFCDLPQELQIKILSNLDAVSLIRCAMTCTSIYETLQGSSLLEYTIELHLDGLKDAGTSLSHPDLIASLRRRRQAWLSLEIKEPLIHLTQPDYAAFELVGGAYADISKDVFGMRWLPTANNLNAAAVHKHSVGILAVNFTMDPTQDLIVFLEEEDEPQTLHIHSISANAAHPRAQQSRLQWTNHPYPYINVVTVNPVIIQIAYNILAILFHNTKRETQLRVWDWTTSELILDSAITSDPFLLARINDFRLLDSTYFLITCWPGLGSIRLYKLVRPPHRREAADQAIHLATLHLPPTAPGVTVHGIQSEAGPIEANPRPGEPFSIDDDARVHLFTVAYDVEGADPNERKQIFLNLFLHQRLLLKYVRKALTEESPLDVPWAEWGPPNTRLTYSPHQYVTQYWKRYIHGQRAIFSDGEIRGVSSSVKIMDFSLAAVLFAKGMLDMPSSASSLKGKAGTLSLSSRIRTADVPIFLDDVETHLPCVTSILELKQDNNIYMIYADGFVGAEYQFGNGLILSIYPI